LVLEGITEVGEGKSSPTLVFIVLVTSKGKYNEAAGGKPLVRVRSVATGFLARSQGVDFPKPVFKDRLSLIVFSFWTS